MPSIHFLKFLVFWELSGFKCSRSWVDKNSSGRTLGKNKRSDIFLCVQSLFVPPPWTKRLIKPINVMGLARPLGTAIPVRLFTLLLESTYPQSFLSTRLKTCTVVYVGRTNKGVGAPAFLTAVISVLPCDFVFFITSENSWEKKYFLCFMDLFSLTGLRLFRMSPSSVRERINGSFL